MNFDIQRLKTTASTNDDVRQAAQNGADEGLVIWALSQSAGRGRQGRQWHSPDGNLYFSVLLRPSSPQRDIGFYSFIAALAVSDALSSFLGDVSIELKWPNDILVDGKKISGILLETENDALIIGAGVNVEHVPAGVPYPVTSLAVLLPSLPSVQDVLMKVLGALTKWCDLFAKAGFAPVRLAWLAKARKGHLRVRLPTKEVHGEFSDLDERGNLCLILQDGTSHSFHTGDVFF